MNKQQHIKIMGVMNVTPDSFFDGGKYLDVNNAVSHGLAMQAAGADIIDIGGESTRPGAASVNAQDEINRVVPVIKALRDKSDVKISIDTSKAEVMKAAIDAGADMINDVRALLEPNALDTAVTLSVPVCLMHMQGQPGNMQNSPKYDNVVQDVFEFLQQRVEDCLSAGLKKENIIIDPGFGFGKTVNHNLLLLKHLSKLITLNYPILIGLSRKSLLGKILNKEVDNRLPGSLALATMGILNGASIVRVHDVKETKQVVDVCNAYIDAN